MLFCFDGLLTFGGGESPSPLGATTDLKNIARLKI